MEPTRELMKFSAAEVAAAKTTAESVCMETTTEAAATESTTEAAPMESTTAMATATAPSQRFVVGKHQDRSEQCTDGNRQKLVSHLTSSCCIDDRITLKRPKSTYRYSGFTRNCYDDIVLRSPMSDLLKDTVCVTPHKT
jgi:hypothetical protein